MQSEAVMRNWSWKNYFSSFKTSYKLIKPHVCLLNIKVFTIIDSLVQQKELTENNCNFTLEVKLKSVLKNWNLSKHHKITNFALRNWIVCSQYEDLPRVDINSSKAWSTAMIISYFITVYTRVNFEFKYSNNYIEKFFRLFTFR